ncbi:MAG: serine/threonine protein kinase [Deltaproteobacteria bacterium]|nr:serine/threonine protein kinase [Deltaproteobacteria bacterium]
MTSGRSGPESQDSAAVTLDGKRPSSELETARHNVVQEREDPWPSTLPTQPPSSRQSLFAGLLAEAAAGSTDDDKKERRRAQDTQDIPGRGRSKSVSGLPRPALDSDRPTLQQPAVPSLVPAVHAGSRGIANYKVLGELGSGGMAVVFKAQQPALDRLVAIKELRAEYMADTQVLARFEREATSLAALQHGNIVHIYDYFRDAESAFIVMEFVDGLDLFDVLAKCGRLPIDVAAILGLQIAEGLEYAHYRGIVHRDIKPSNILISKNGEVKLMDFGIARDPGRADLTQIGMSLGTPAYMAPEQIAGDKIDFRADLFSFGICLYEMLTGHRPWGDDDGQAITRKVLYEGFTPVTTHRPDIPEPLERIIEACLEKYPDNRYKSTYELRRALAAFTTANLKSDPRQRVVVFLKNRGMAVDGGVAGHVDPALLGDEDVLRADRGIAPLPPSALLRPAVGVGIVAALAAMLAALLGTMGPFGSSAEGERPALKLEAKP